MDDTIRKLDGLVGGNQKLNTAVSRTQLKALADVILEQQKNREKDMRSSVEVMVSVGERKEWRKKEWRKGRNKVNFCER